MADQKEKPALVPPQPAVVPTPPRPLFDRQIQILREIGASPKSIAIAEKAAKGAR